MSYIFNDIEEINTIITKKNGDFEFILKFHKKEKSFSKHLHL